MSNFKQLITEIRTQMDKDVKFLIDHGIDPSTKYSNIPLYDPELDSLVILRGPVKTSPYFTNNEIISPKDSVIIQTIKEERVPTTDPNDPANYYTKEYGEKIEITVDEFKNRIYNNPRNEETISYLKLQDLDTAEKISQANTAYIDARNYQDKTKQAEFEEWVNQYGDLFDIDNFTAADKKLALDKLYKANKQGYAIKDLAKLPIIWKIKNKKALDIIDVKIKSIKNKDKQAELKAEFEKKQKEWFRAKLDTVDTLKAVLEWWKEINIKEESVLTEYGFPQTQKPTPIKDKYEVKQTLIKLFGTDADKFVTVPIIKAPLYNREKYKSPEDDPASSRMEKLTVVSFPDQSKLDDKFGLVRVKDSISGETYNMNISELRQLIDKPENQNTELDTVDYRLKGGNEFTSLNQGMGKFIDLPEEVIIEMLKTVNAENDDYEYIDLVEYYNEEKKSGIANPLLTKALSEYNQGNNSQFVIRKFDTADGIKYKGFIPNEEHIHSKPAVTSGDKYKQLMK